MGSRGAAGANGAREEHRAGDTAKAGDDLLCVTEAKRVAVVRRRGVASFFRAQNEGVAVRYQRIKRVIAPDRVESYECCAVSREAATYHIQAARASSKAGAEEGESVKRTGAACVLSPGHVPWRHMACNGQRSSPRGLELTSTVLRSLV